MEKLISEIKSFRDKLSIENSEEICYKIADKLFNETQLCIDDKCYDFCELEFYIYDKDHNDPYVHKNDLQKKFWGFYVHKKDGKYGGIDLTLGDEQELYFGVLIRGLKVSNSDTIIEGPNRVKKMIYSLLDVKNYKDLQSIINENINITKKEEKLDHKLHYSTRVGLKPKPEDKKYFENKLYRFIAYPNNYSFKEKRKAIECSQDSSLLV